MVHLDEILYEGDAMEGDLSVVIFSATVSAILE
jgi:hypothetical protein